MAKKFYLNTLSGVVDRIDEHVAEHPTFAPYMLEVLPGTKSYAPEMYRPMTVTEYLDTHRREVGEAAIAADEAAGVEGE